MKHSVAVAIVEVCLVSIEALQDFLQRKRTGRSVRDRRPHALGDRRQVRRCGEAYAMAGRVGHGRCVPTCLVLVAADAPKPHRLQDLCCNSRAALTVWKEACADHRRAAGLSRALNS